jgi:hypothetical protein
MCLIASTCIQLPPTFIIGNLDQFVRYELFPRLPKNIKFEPLATDKFYFASTMTRIGGLKDEFLGTVDSFLDRFDGEVPRIRVVIYRDQRESNTCPHSRVGKAPPITVKPAPMGIYLPQKTPAVFSAPSAVEIKPDVEDESQKALKRPRSQRNAPRRGQRRWRG